jgi:hypothetical protein
LGAGTCHVQAFAELVDGSAVRLELGGDLGQRVNVLVFPLIQKLHELGVEARAFFGVVLHGRHIVAQHDHELALVGLAPLLVKQIFESIVNVTKQYGLSVVLVEQNAMGALNIADSGIVLNLGKVVISGTSQSLINDPAVQAAYLGY